MSSSEDAPAKYSYFGTWAATGMLGSLARQRDGEWERYQYQNKQWSYDRQVGSDVVYSGDWYPATLDEVEYAISKYEKF